ncbi:hypothetical protein ACD591_14340 [Rufibacter glacialis]|uniref:DUF4097 domain-containing protein n=1 Tax=Rufibacter glacialis TaxID=1259555 RepID=A0A5M8Q787_9BACT|nr:hypothetical protein [Rufibacter glacialis]KAA6430978.1 hypothetical protein FOE74_17890 [Rufibacter glacialis]GGK83012.1 hypothetical protein GCM10011405_33550 [Rufibacter glacialis]
MKNVLLLALLLLGIGNLHAQKKTVEKTLVVPASKKVHLNLKFGNEVKVTGWDKKEAYVKVTYELNGGTLNQAMLLTFDPGKDQLSVTADLDEKLLKNSTYEGNCDGGATTTFGNYANGKMKSGVCTRIDYEIFLPRDANLTLETINGNLELRGIHGTVQAKSISGFVDMDWPTQKGATVALKTITGEVYSDLALTLPEKKKETPMVGYQLKGNVHNGGPKIQLETISNNIYFRQKK